jgi:hypothetical protein
MSIYWYAVIAFLCLTSAAAAAFCRPPTFKKISFEELTFGEAPFRVEGEHTAQHQSSTQHTAQGVSIAIRAKHTAQRFITARSITLQDSALAWHGRVR